MRYVFADGHAIDRPASHKARALFSNRQRPIALILSKSERAAFTDRGLSLCTAILARYHTITVDADSVAHSASQAYTG